MKLTSISKKSNKEEPKAKTLKLNKTTMAKLQGGQTAPIPGIGIPVVSHHPCGKSYTCP